VHWHIAGTPVHKALDHEVLGVLALLEDRGTDWIQRLVVDQVAEEEREQVERDREGEMIGN
jgi:hypothetical protein